jgi:hypothetical protein
MFNTLALHDVTKIELITKDKLQSEPSYFLTRLSITDSLGIALTIELFSDTKITIQEA